MIPSKRIAPTVSERSTLQIAKARKAIKEGTFLHGSAKLENEFVKLDIYTAAERLAAVKKALAEIKPKHRRGPQPPNHKSLEPKFVGKRMYAFVWDSTQFKANIYIKFCFAGDLLVLFSFHESRYP